MDKIDYSLDDKDDNYEKFNYNYFPHLEDSINYNLDYYNDIKTKWYIIGLMLEEHLREKYKDII